MSAQRASRSKSASHTSSNTGPRAPHGAGAAGVSHRWSAKATAHSNALDLDRSIFTWKDPHRIAASLKLSAERSERRKSDPYRSAMSMLTFYINRAGDNLSASQRAVLERAKEELRRVFGRESGTRGKTPAKTRAASRTKE